jgi:RimJ/RimL family protein N-acetyltransferase
VCNALARTETTYACSPTPPGPRQLFSATGLANRVEVAVEIEPNHRNLGMARRALTEARRIVQADQMLFAQTAPGNAASIRTLLTAGFQPIGSEVLFFEHTPASAD